MAEAQSGNQSQGGHEYHTIFIRCCGKHDEIKHYIAFGMKQTQPGSADVTVNLYKVLVDERIEQVTVLELDSENVILQSSGGLFDPIGKMTVIDPVKNKVRGTLDNHRIDVTIMKKPIDYIKWRWDFNSIVTNNNEKSLHVRNQTQ